MAVTSMDSIAKGEIPRYVQRSQSDQSKIHHGFKVCVSGIPSIPSRYLTITNNNNEKHGFQQTAKRFSHALSFTPGPGQYQTQQTLEKQLESPSSSKKGTGSFASHTRRDFSVDPKLRTPAPTSYNIAGKFGHEHQDFNRSQFSSMFQKPIAEPVLSPKTTMPAPNQYDIDQGLKKITKSNNVSAQAAFKSHTMRATGPNKHFITPAPGAYNVDDSLTRSLAPVHQSSFKSTSRRDPFGVNSEDELPGPADYRPFERLKEEPYRQLFHRHHYLAISAPAIPPPPEEPLPGPGAYEIRNFRGVEKKYLSSAVFLSNSSRWSVDILAAGQRPGPASYKPRAPIKQSFNFNFGRKWLS